MVLFLSFILMLQTYYLREYHAKLNIKKSEDLKEKAFCKPENFLKDARQPLVVDASLPL